MELRHARLGDAEHLADLPQGQLLVVVEGDDELLALRQPGDGLAEGFLQLGGAERGLGRRRIDVLDRVDQGDLVAAGAADRPELVERCDRRAGDVGQAVLELLGGDPDVLRDLLVGRRAVQLGLESRHRPLDLAGTGANRARHPVERPKLVDDRALDPRDGIGLELDVPVGVVALDRADQAEEAVRDEVLLLDVRGQSAAQPAGYVLDERRVGEDQAIAQRLVVRLGAKRAPESLGVVDLRAHELEKDTALTGHLLTRRAERADCEARHPERSGRQRRPRSPRPRRCTRRLRSRQRRRSGRRRGRPVRGAALPWPRREPTRRPLRRPRLRTRRARRPRGPRAAGRSCRGCARKCVSTIERKPRGVAQFGRAPVSKTGGCRFESCRPCWADQRVNDPLKR